MIKFSGAALSAALLVSTLATIPASAAIQIAVSDDNGATYHDVTGILGVANNTWAFNDGSGISLTSNTGFGAPAIDGLLLTSGDIAINGRAGARLTIAISDNSYTSPTGLAVLNDQLSATDLEGIAKFTLIGYEDNSDNLFASSTGKPGVLDSTHTKFAHTDGTANAAQFLSFTGQDTASGSTGPFMFSSPYSLTEIATVTFLSSGSVTTGFSAQLAGAAVPEPASIMLFGTVLAGAALVMRKRLLAAN
jgi:hypothetical protein